MTAHLERLTAATTEFTACYEAVQGATPCHPLPPSPPPPPRPLPARPRLAAGAGAGAGSKAAASVEIQPPDQPRSSRRELKENN